PRPPYDARNARRRPASWHRAGRWRAADFRRESWGTAWCYIEPPPTGGVHRVPHMPGEAGRSPALTRNRSPAVSGGGAGAPAARGPDTTLSRKAQWVHARV